jgi:hypothetical protein
MKYPSKFQDSESNILWFSYASNDLFCLLYLTKQLKEKFRTSQQGGLFGGLLKAEQFVAANLPANYDQAVSFICTSTFSSFPLKVS